MTADAQRTYAMLAKPVSGACNLRCEYCYYAGKESALGVGTSRMSDTVLEAYIRQSLAMHGKDARVEFAWHGGEPTLAGLTFYETVVRLQDRYGQGRHIVNTLQTNATLLTDELCRFFKAHGFLIGVSIDGPEELHNVYRKTAGGEGSFDKTMRGVELLQKHGVAFNTLTTVNRANQESPREVYAFLRSWTDWMQFLPVVECAPAVYETEEGQMFAAPPGIHGEKIKHPLMPFSVTPEGCGAFLCAVFDEWKRRDAGKKHVQIIDVTLGNLHGVPSSLCVHNPLCGHSGSVEANGDVYACDRYAFPAYRLGNLTETELGALMEANRAFGMHKTYGLPEDCLDCPYIRLCFGGCPKDRLWGNKNYLCDGYRTFFEHIEKNF
ncbi:MAG: anaerobic sulfatase maturase [Ruminococcaceae bacterium]|nr:anaerobic sulfatase maturase [Oscillospiraceae bacterium]